MTDALSRWYSAVPCGTSDATTVVLDHASHDDFAKWALNAAHRIDDWPLDASMSCRGLRGSRFPDDVIPNHLGALVLSERAKGVVEAADPEAAYAQFLPVRVDYAGNDLGSYYLLNALAAYAAMDRERSHYTVATRLDVNPRPVGAVRAIRRLHLDGERLGDHVPLFRLAEDPRWLLVHRSLHDRWQAAGITGMYWLPVSDNI